MRHGRPVHSAAVLAALGLLRQRGTQGATSRDLAEAAATLDPRDLVLTLRQAGYAIETRQERTTAAGRRVYRYTLSGAA